MPVSVAGRPVEDGLGLLVDVLVVDAEEGLHLGGGGPAHVDVLLAALLSLGRAGQRLGAAAEMMGWTREAAAAAEYFAGGDE